MENIDETQIFINKHIIDNFNYFLYAFIFYLPLINLLENYITKEFSVKNIQRCFVLKLIQKTSLN